MRHIFLLLNRVSVLIGTSLFLFFAYPAEAGDQQTSGNDQLVLQNPTPELSASASRSLVLARLASLITPAADIDITTWFRLRKSPKGPV